MKVRCDEHISPRIVSAIREIAISAGWEISSVIEVGHGGDGDVHWITKFADEGGDAIISADKDFVTLAPQINAVFDTGLKVILLPKKWGQERGLLQAAHILQWWPRIESKMQAMNPRECYCPDWNIRTDGELKKVKINFAKAQKVRRKKNKRKLKITTAP